MLSKSHGTVFLIVVWLMAIIGCATEPIQATKLTINEDETQTEVSATISTPINHKWQLWQNGTQLRGANIYQRRVYPEIDGNTFLGNGPVGPPYIQKDFDDLAGLGANYVNISHPGLFTETPPYVLDETIQTNLDNLLAMIAQANMFAVISFRTGPGRSEFTFFWDEVGSWFDKSYLNDTVWQDQAAQDAWVEMWRHTAARYQSNPIVVGYDLMVEPNANEVGADALNAPLNVWDPVEFENTYGGSLYDWNQLHPRISAAIRTIDEATPILTGGMAYSEANWLSWIKPTSDDRTVYIIHQYAPTKYTHQSPDAADCPSYPGQCDVDWDGEKERFDQTWLANCLSVIKTFQTEHNAPVAVNEFGLSRWEPNAALFMQDQIALFEAQGMNYALWAWDPAWPEWAAEVDSFNFRHGPDPGNHVNVSNALEDVIVAAWKQNEVRPSPSTPTPVSPNIHIDQLGYLPNAVKIAVVANPQVGYNAAQSFTPGSTYQVRDAVTDAVVYSGGLTAWNDGATHDQSGDQVWWFDFTTVTTPGSYIIYDPDNDVASYPFEIGEDVYVEMMAQAMRTFYYQRFNFAKQQPYAEANWVDAAAFDGPEQGADTRAINPSNPYSSDPATAKDLRGGWFDAGDLNKYVNFADGVIHDLLFAYEQNPTVWRDNYNIPESGNGIPDMLDELKYELDWLLKMQVTTADTSMPNFNSSDVGSVLHKVSVVDWNSGAPPPSADTSMHRYAPPTTSATISAAGAYAHAALVYQASSDATLQTFGQKLETAAVNAWNWLQANPAYSTYDNAGFVNVSAEDNVEYQKANKLAAAIYLFALTGEAEYGSYIEANIADGLLINPTDPNDFDNAYLLPDGPRLEAGNAQLLYAHLPTANKTIANQIIDKYSFAATNPWVPYAPFRNFQEKTDAYRAYLDLHYWGSNRPKSNTGNLLMNMAYYGLDGGNGADYETAASGYTHYLHGVNPIGIFYFSNMSAHGVENSVPEFFHLWFSDGSDWDNVESSLYGPAPGFLVGGVNEFFGLKDSITVDGTSLFADQPPLKAYRSWNDPNENSWEISENSITYQAAYIRLLANFLPSANALAQSIYLPLTVNGN